MLFSDYIPEDSAFVEPFDEDAQERIAIQEEGTYEMDIEALEEQMIEDAWDNLRTRDLTESVPF